MGCWEHLDYKVKIYETSEAGRSFEEISIESNHGKSSTVIELFPDDKYQTITGFGGSFTEASAFLLNQMSRENRQRIIEAYFGNSGARYSLTRTHINSCDFSLTNYSYAPKFGDTELLSFRIDEDMDDIIPMIKDALEVSSEGFKIIASPWTAPPWMKDNNDWRGGKLLPEHYPTWAKYFKKYIEEYRLKGINIWAVTIENEPLGNGNTWESMHFAPEEMNEFVKNHLGPLFKSAQLDIKILGYDHNRDEELYRWADIMYDDAEASKYYNGMAVHWYASTYDYFPEALQYVHKKAPLKHLIQTEACIDAQVPVWKDDKWYWSAEATDWGWNWAPEDKKYLHPKYIPAFRYARDIIGCLNNWVDGWIDWNMVLDRQGGPNWIKNWCIAPVIVDPDRDEVYFTPLYFVIMHFSKYIRPGATRIGYKISDADLMATAVQNPDNSLAVVVFNPTDKAKSMTLIFKSYKQDFTIDAKAIQTITLAKRQIKK